MPARRPSAMRRRSAAGVRLVSSATATGRSPSSDPSSTTERPAEHPAHRELVLFGEHLGRRHERALVPPLHGHQQRGERDDRLARPHLALEQPVHRCGLGHVVGDLRDRRRLVVREREGQGGVERGDQLAVDRVLDAGGLGGQRALAGDERELHAEELVELETLRRRDAIGRGRRPVDVVVRAPAVDQVVVGDAARRRADRRTRAPSCARGTTPPRAAAARCAPRPCPTGGRRGRSCR